MTEFDTQLATLVVCLQLTKNIIAAMQAMQLSDEQRDSVHVALSNHLPRRSVQQGGREQLHRPDRLPHQHHDPHRRGPAPSRERVGRGEGPVTP